MHGRLVSSGFTLGAGEQRCSAELQQDPERKMTLTLLIVDPKVRKQSTYARRSGRWLWGGGRERVAQHLTRPVPHDRDQGVLTRGRVGRLIAIAVALLSVNLLGVTNLFYPCFRLLRITRPARLQTVQATPLPGDIPGHIHGRVGRIPLLSVHASEPDDNTGRTVPSEARSQALVGALRVNPNQERRPKWSLWFFMPCLWNF